MTPDADETWSRIRAELSRAVEPDVFEIWLSGLQLLELGDGQLVLTAPPDRRKWIADRFASLIERCAARVLGHRPVVDVLDAGTTAAPPEDELVAPSLDPRGRADLNPKLIFGQFVIGDSNRLAHAAALAVAELPGTAYNPLFIYGPPGVGKTHLLHAIANYLVTYSPHLRVRCTTAELFTNEFVAAAQTKDMDRFKGTWRSTDVLLVDDIQFLESKVRTEEEFFHTFNELYDAGAQVVLTSDRLPRDLDALEERLRERFEAGLVTDIAHPDHAMRIAILRKRADQDGLDVGDPTVLDAIARRIDGSIRELEGALIRVVAYASLTNRRLTPELAVEVLASLYPGGARPGTSTGTPTIAAIQEAVCSQFGLTADELLGAGRSARIAGPRQLAMYLARVHTHESLPAIGAAFGGRNHTTVMHAVKKVQGRLGQDADLDEAVRALTTRLADRHD